MKETKEKKEKKKELTGSEITHIFCNFGENVKSRYYSISNDKLYHYNEVIAKRYINKRTKTILIKSGIAASRWGNAITTYDIQRSVPTGVKHHIVSDFEGIKLIQDDLEEIASAVYHNDTIINSKCRSGHRDIDEKVTLLKLKIKELNRLFGININNYTITDLYAKYYTGWNSYHHRYSINTTVIKYLNSLKYTIKQIAILESKCYFHYNDITGYSTEEKVDIWLDPVKKEDLHKKVGEIQIKRQKEKEFKELQRNLEYYNHIRKWANFILDSRYTGYGWCNYKSMRIEDDIIRTSSNAVITIPEGKLIYALFSKCKNTNSEMFDINRKFGYYTLNSICKEQHTLLNTECWVINIGCHKIDEFVIMDFAQLNNW